MEMKVRTFCLGCCFLFVIFVAALVISAPFLVNTAPVKERILALIQKKTGVFIPSQGFSLYLSMDGFGLCLTIQLKDMNLAPYPGVNLCIGQARILWKIPDLFQRQYVCHGIDVDRATVDWIPVRPENSSGVSPPDNWDFLFSWLPRHQGKVDLVFHHLSCPFFASASGICSLYPSTKSVKAVSSIRDILFQKKFLTDHHPEYQPLPFDLIQAKTCRLTIQAQLSGSRIQAKTIFKGAVMESFLLNQPVQALSDIAVSCSLEPGKFDLKIDPVKWKFPESRIRYSWTWNQDRKPAWHMVFSGQDINVDQAAKMSIDLGEQSQVVQNLFGILRGGQAQKVEVSFASNTLEDMFDPYGMTISGSLEKGEVHIPATPYALTDVQGTAVMKKGVLKVQTELGNLGNTRVGPSAFEIDLLHPKDFPFQGEFDLDADIAQLPEVFSTLLPGTVLAREMTRIRSASGRVQGVLSIDCQAEQPLRIRADAKNISGTIDYEPFGLPLDIHTGTVFYTHEKIRFEHIFADIGKNAVRDFSGQAEFCTPHTMEIFSGTASLDPGQFIVPFQNFSCLPSNIFTDVQGSVDLESISVKGPCLLPGKWEYQVSGKCRGLEWEFSPGTDWAFEIPGLKPLSGQFVLTNKEIHWQDETGSQARGSLRKTEHGIQIQLDHLDLCNFVARGSVLLSLDYQGVSIDGAVHIESMDQESTSSLFSYLLKDESMIEGPYSFSCDLRCKGPVKDFKNSVHGELSFSSANGRIYRATFLARVLSVINVLHLLDVTKQGFDYRSIEIQGKVEGGKIWLTHAVVDAKDMFLVFSGWVDPFADKLDLDCLMAPLKTVDSIIQYIPLVNVIVGKKLVSIPIRIQGSVKEPGIMILHPSDVGEGLVNLFERIITAPARLFHIQQYFSDQEVQP